MGMVGVVFVRPSQNTLTTKYAYNDDDGSTAYDREFALLLQDVWTVPHDNLASIQETVWSDFDANYWVINGRCYPDTVQPNLGEAGDLFRRVFLGTVLCLERVGSQSLGSDE